eukprot:CAMPEP_0172527952 /NCGR_PEP_ID=MMETSP1067-20121228/2487_1 /TAXON_ID=265564 ORGANISM="Thalassiosira punctigera, Strain Tpunct2005C2" /NCGR_SAMPLE_ID=MMETSP1067 /ASSEMBLY_ACC=CAM_ASM_000444 /LENGTH=140 /DNA_ID=CAMNT_0013311783 /DNA_START=482 /DNA_END=901 /DNA_ORIENTATION=+
MIAASYGPTDYGSASPASVFRTNLSSAPSRSLEIPPLPYADGKKFGGVPHDPLGCPSRSPEGAGSSPRGGAPRGRRWPGSPPRPVVLIPSGVASPPSPGGGPRMMSVGDDEIPSLPPCGCQLSSLSLGELLCRRRRRRRR